MIETGEDRDKAMGVGAIRGPGAVQIGQKNANTDLLEILSPRSPEINYCEVKNKRKMDFNSLKPNGLQKDLCVASSVPFQPGLLHSAAIWQVLFTIQSLYGLQMFHGPKMDSDTNGGVHSQA